MNEKVRQFFSNKYVAFITQIVAVLFGSFLMGIAYRNFYVTAVGTITPSGFSGLATIIEELFRRVGLIIPASVIYLVVNIFLFMIALKFFGLKFGLLTLLGIVGYSFSMQYFTILPLQQNNLLLSAIIGGVMLGAGLGITIRFGGSTGGTDIIVLLINKFSPKIRAGQCTFVINACIVIFSMFVFSVEMALYALVAIFLSGRVTDVVLDGTRSARAYYIICNKDEEIADEIMKTFHRGVTKLNATGEFSHKEKKMLVCLVTNFQAPVMKDIVRRIDPDSFVYSTSVCEAIGESMFLRQEATQRVMTMRHLTNSKFRLAEQTGKRQKDVTFKYFTSYPLRTRRDECLIKTDIKYNLYKKDE